jgi:hypothetical protein
MRRQKNPFNGKDRTSKRIQKFCTSPDYSERRIQGDRETHWLNVYCVEPSRSAWLRHLAQGQIRKECIVFPSPYQSSVPREKCLVKIRAQQYLSEMPETLHTHCRSRRPAICQAWIECRPSYTPLREMVHYKFSTNLGSQNRLRSTAQARISIKRWTNQIEEETGTRSRRSQHDGREIKVALG